MEMQELRRLGKEKFGTACRMCPVCDGRACAGEIPGAGGVGTGTSFQNNISDLAEVCFRQRVIHNVENPATDYDLWGHSMAMPILAAPIGGIAFNWNNFMPEAEYAEAVVLGCRNAGAIGMTGDGKLPEIFLDGLKAIELVRGWGIPTIKPRANEDIIELARLAERAGAMAVAVDIDSAALINMTASGQPVGPKTYQDLLKLKKHIHVPLIVKGIMDIEDAKSCKEAGVDGIVVSNHGGRVLDYTPGTARMLPMIADRCGGDDMKIFVDGGIRSGFDVLKMLALGADAVLVGRPVTQAAVGGAEGVKCLMQHLQSQLKAAMIMTGCLNVYEITADILYTE